MVLIDFILVVIVFIYLKARKEINFLCPAFLYLIFHLIFITLRSIQIFVFDSDLIVNVWFSHFMTYPEIEKAIIVSDISLVAFMVGFFINIRPFKKKGFYYKLKSINHVDKKSNLINRYIKVILVLGVFGLLIAGSATPTEGTVHKSNILLGAIQNLGIIAAIILIFEKGFSLKSMLFFSIMVFFFSIQGYHRYRVILPMIFILNVYLRKRNLSFPPRKFLILGTFFFLLSFPLKHIGRAIQNNESVNLIEVTASSARELFTGTSGDLSFLEQSASAISGVDNTSGHFYGSTYQSLVVFWIPRALWSGKPRLNEWQHDISTKGRRLAEFGMISLLAGESYANFSFLGVFVVSLLLARLLSLLYYKFKDAAVNSKGFLILLFANMIFFQVWRDGLISMVVFPLINYFPIIILIFLKTSVKK